MTRCEHCELPLGSGQERFCCAGCARVHALLHEEGLGRYYELRRGPGVAVDDVAPTLEGADWIDRVDAGENLDLDVQGLHCAACVWLLESLYERHGAGELEVSSALGRASLRAAPGDDVRGFVSDVERFGYRVRPAGDADRGATDGLLLRLGVSVALAGNGMMYALATYVGLESGPVHRFFAQLGMAAATLSVLVGGSYFIGRSGRALLRRQVSLDLPIALGILLAYAGALFSFFVRGEARYADTLSIFVALMLGGRWLRERALERDRARASQTDGAEHLEVRLAEHRTIGVRQLRPGMRVWLERGGLVPVASVLEEGPARFRLDWIDGEAEPRTFAAGELVPAGAFLAEGRAHVVRAEETFEDSALSRLLTRPVHRATGGSRFWSRAALLLVAVVLLSATVGGVVWVFVGGPAMALEVATAILVVSCPCAFGLAAPMAHELAAARLRRRGLFVRSADLFDRALRVRRVVLDKTGTLTTGAPTLREPSTLDALDASAARTLATLAAASSHPKARAVREALEARGVRPDPEARPEEVLGHGMQLGGARLGAPAWVGVEGGDLAFADGTTTLELPIGETVRPDVAAELTRLRDMGLGLTILSGDRPDRVSAVAGPLGISEAFGDQRPEAKAAWIEAHDPEHTLFLGDGLNDAPAADAAGVSGCAALDRPFMAARTDFFVTGAGLAPLQDLLLTARELRHTLRVVYVFALTYNLGAIAVAAAGLMAPWLAAVVMPISSLATLTYVGWRLGPRTLRASSPRRAIGALVEGTP